MITPNFQILAEFILSIVTVVISVVMFSVSARYLQLFIVGVNNRSSAAESTNPSAPPSGASENYSYHGILIGIGVIELMISLWDLINISLAMAHQDIEVSIGNQSCMQ